MRKLQSNKRSNQRLLQFRPALPHDCYRIRQLLRSCDRSPRSVTGWQLAKRYFGLGLLIAAGLHGLMLLGGLSVMLSGMLTLATLALVCWLNLWSFTDWQHYWVVEYQQCVVACGKVLYHASYGILCNVVVTPEMRQQGIGSFLVSSIVGQVTFPLYLACAPERLLFYQRLGFIKLEARSLNAYLKQELGLTAASKLLPMIHKQ